VPARVESTRESEPPELFRQLVQGTARRWLTRPGSAARTRRRPRTTRDRERASRQRISASHGLCTPDRTSPGADFPLAPGTLHDESPANNTDRNGARNSSAKRVDATPPSSVLGATETVRRDCAQRKPGPLSSISAPAGSSPRPFVRGARRVIGNSRTAIHIGRVLYAAAPRGEDPDLQERARRRAQASNSVSRPS